MKDKISVVIPCYNGGAYLEACVASVNCRADVELEIVIVDDGSADDTAEVCKRLVAQDGRIRYHYQENAGVSAARNAGLTHATGDFVMFCDADDVLADDAVDRLYDAICRTDSDMASGLMSVQKSDASEVCEPENESVTVYDHPDDIMKRCLHTAYDSVCGKLYRRERLTGISFEVGRKINEDVFFVFQCLTRCRKVVEINRTVYRYLYHKGSASHTVFAEKHYDVLYFMERKLDFLRERYPHLKRTHEAVALRHLITFFLKYVRSDASEKEKNAIRRQIFRNRKGARLCSKREQILTFVICYAYPIFRYRYRKKR